MGLTQNHEVQVYINNVCSQIKNRQVHEEIKTELLGHIEEIVTEQVSSGVAEDEAAAVEKAISQMGDAEVVGRRLHKVHKTQPEWSVLAITLIFASIGLMAMYFIESQEVLLYNGQVFVRSIVSTLLGLAVVCGLYFLDYRKLQLYSKYIYAGTLLILMYTVHFGTAINGVRSMIRIGPVNINFVSASPFLFIIALAGLFGNWNWKEPKKVLYGLVLAIIPGFIMLMAPSLSSCITYSAAFVTLMVVSGIKLKHMLSIIGSGVGVAIFFIITVPYRIERYLIFLDPGKDLQRGGWIYVQLNKAIQSAGFLGQSFNFDPGSIPEVHTDFVFTYIVYTFGWAAGILTAALVAAFLIRITRIAAGVKNSYGRLLVSGFAAAFAVQFIWNILMNLGLAPISGFELPFISFGGTQFIMNMAAIGIISSVYKLRTLSKTAI